ncbi:MAG: hypothetical protein IJL36_06355 [Clostridia bacterium]|nr:hypothetical protein [Clostridia bacterium]
MKKQYVAPMADKVDFDYEENVTASGAKQHDCSGKSYSWSWSWSWNFNFWDLLKKIFH